MLKRYLFFVISIFILSIHSGCKWEDSSELPEVKLGILNLKKTDFIQEKIPLKGDWEFYWNEFRNEFNSSQDPNKNFAYVPSHWIELKTGTEEFVSIEGIATFKSTLILPEVDYKLGLRIPPMDTAFVLYWNGNEIARNGNIFKENGDILPHYYAPLIVALENIKKGENELYIHMANSIYPRPGFRDLIILGSYDDLNFEYNYKIAIDIFLVGGIFIIGLYHLGLWVLRRKDISLLWFSLLSFTLALRVPVQGEAFSFQFFPIYWKLSTFIEYLTFYLAYGILGLFIRSLYPKESINILDRFVFAGVGLFIGILIVFPLSIYSRTLLYFEILSIFLTGYYFFILVKASIYKRQLAFGFIIALFLFLLTYINDVLYANRIIESFYMTGIGLFVFFFAQAFLLSKRFANAFNTAESLTLELDAKVKERTKDLAQEKEKSDKLLKNIQRDLNYSKRIQNSILPRIPNQPGFKVDVLYNPMNEVGGDIYDFFKLKKDKNKYRFMIADATGHGVQGALVTMAIKSEYENLKKFIRTPSELMEVLNISIINTYKTMYFTCVIVDIDLDKMILEYSSAGHPEQVIIRGSELISQYKTGPIIGLKQNIEYSSKIIEVKNNDSIYIFSDGIFEVFNNDHEEFGEEKFYNLLKECHDEPPKRQIEYIMETLEKFKGSNRFEDDITLIVLKLDT